MGWDRKKKKIGNLHGDKCCKEHRAWGWKRSLRVRFSSKRIRKGFIKKMTSVQRYEGSEGAAMGKSALGRGDQCRALPSQCGFSSLHINGTAFLKCTNDFLIVGGILKIPFVSSSPWPLCCMCTISLPSVTFLSSWDNLFCCFILFNFFLSFVSYFLGIYLKLFYCKKNT